MTVTLTGSNSYLLRRRLDELTSQFADKFGELAIERIDAELTEPAAILSVVSSLPFLSDNKLVIISGLSSSKSAAEHIEQIISSISPEVDVIIVEPSPDKRTAYYRALKDQTRLEEFNDLEPNQLAKWLVLRAGELGAEMDLSSAIFLIDRVGANQAGLENELQKLALYDKAISKQTIELLTDRTPQSRVFDLLDAAFGGKQQRAQELYEEQRAQKVEPQTIAALITWQLQMIALAGSAGTRPMSQVASEAKLSPYALNKAKALSSKLNQKELGQVIGRATEMDYKAKTFQINLDEALKNFIVGLKR